MVGSDVSHAMQELLEAAKGNVEQLEETLTMAAPEAKDLGEKVSSMLRHANYYSFCYVRCYLLPPTLLPDILPAVRL